MIEKVASGITGVYALRHDPSGAVYVGVSKRCVGNRLSWHMTALRKGFHGSPRLSALWAASTPEEWSFVILEQCAPELCPEREKYWCTQFADHLGDHLATGFTVPEHVRKKQRAGRARYLEAPGARESLSERAVAQHAQGNFGAATWADGPDYQVIADKWSRTEENRQRLRDHVAEQTSEEMSHRSRCRKMFS